MGKLSRNPGVLIVGGGLAGLSVGAYLARAGLRPTVIERAAELGGRASTRRRGDYLFNVGAHALYRGGAAVDVLRELQIAYTGGVPNVAGEALYGGQFHLLPVTTSTLVRTGLLGLRAKLELGRTLAALPRLNPVGARDLTIGQWLDGHIESVEARRVVLAFVRLATYANAPEEFSAATALSQLQKALKNVIYVDDGWQSLVQKLEEQIRTHGGRILGGTRVSCLTREADGDYKLTLDGAPDEKASSVVIATEARDAGKLVEKALGRLPHELSAPLPVRACVLDVALDRLPRKDRTFVLGIDEPLYLSVHSRVARLAPDGGALIHTLKYLPSEETDPEQDRRELECLLDGVQPGWRELACEVQFLPRMKVATWLERPFAPRPEPRLAELPGVWFAGDWVQSEGWLSDGSLGSARDIVPEIIEHVKWARAA